MATRAKAWETSELFLGLTEGDFRKAAGMADFAEMIGTTRETVSHQMNRFQRMGLAVTRGRMTGRDRREEPKEGAHPAQGCAMEAEAGNP